MGRGRTRREQAAYLSSEAGSTAGRAGRRAGLRSDRSRRRGSGGVLDRRGRRARLDERRCRPEASPGGTGQPDHVPPTPASGPVPRLAGRPATTGLISQGRRSRRTRPRGTSARRSACSVRSGRVPQASTASRSFDPAALGRQVPTISWPDNTAPGRPSVRQSSLRRAPSGTTSSRSRPCRKRSNGPSSRTSPSGALGDDRASASVFQHRAHLALPVDADLDVDHVGGPVLGDVLDRGVEIAGDQLRGRGTEQMQDGAYRVEPRRHLRGRTPPSPDPLEDGWRGARSKLEAGPQGGQPEGLLIEMDGVARPAEAAVGLRQLGRQAGGHLTLDGRLGHQRPHLWRRSRRGRRAPGCRRP